MGLRANDLKDTVLDIFEVDSFQSKMGDDRDVCVISFTTTQRGPARDMMEFIEKGYNFVLDSDLSAGEDTNGNYHVFVELNRDPDLGNNIKDLLSGIDKLTGKQDWKFKYYKSPKTHSFDRGMLENLVPTTPVAYDTMMEQTRINQIESFFKSTYKTEIVVEGNIVTIKKPFGVSVQFEIAQIGNRKEIQKDLSETIRLDTKSTAEVLWLTKLLGEYNITKYGDDFVLENGNKAMRIKLEGI